MERAKVAMVLDTRRIKKDGCFPIKLRLTYERKQQYYATIFNLNRHDFDIIMFGKKLTTTQRELKRKITAIEDKANEIIDAISLFSFKAFEKHYLTNRGAKDTIAQAYLDYITELRNTGQIGTAVAYECAISSLNKFDTYLKFADITPDFLKKYETWMLQKGRSANSISIYLRTLRTLFNNAINEGLLKKELYPFGKRKYEIPTGRNIKKALTLSDIELIYNYKAPKNSMDERAKDYWIFMYLCNGINVKDLCLLKFENIKNDFIEYERAKTARTKRTVEPIRVVITDDVKAIIDKWGNKDKEAKNYIFPILENGLTPTRQRQLIQQLTQVINCHMKKIAKEIGIENNVTTYAARHSFATILQRSGVSTEFISEALGHGNLKTTQSYLAGFEDKQKRETIKALTAFKNSDLQNSLP